MSFTTQRMVKDGLRFTSFAIGWRTQHTLIFFPCLRLHNVFDDFLELTRFEFPVWYPFGKGSVSFPQRKSVRRSLIYVDHTLTCLLRKGGRVKFPTGGQSTPKFCPMPRTCFTGRQDILTNIFLIIWGSNMSLSYTNSAVPGRAKLRSNLLTHAR